MSKRIEWRDGVGNPSGWMVKLVVTIESIDDSVSPCSLVDL